MAPTISTASMYATQNTRDQVHISEQFSNGPVCKHGHKQAIDRVWHRIKDVDSLDHMVKLVRKFGYLPIVLQRKDLLRQYNEIGMHGKEVEFDFAEVIGKLGSFGCMADAKIDEDHGNKELIDREFELIALGVPKCTINMIVRAMERCKNSGKAMCIIIDFCPLETDDINQAAMTTATLLNRDKDLLNDYNPTIVLGCKEGDTVTRVDKDYVDDESDGSRSDGSDKNTLDDCNFCNMAMLTIEASDDENSMRMK